MRRTEIIASAIPEKCSVLDLGGGLGNLCNCLEGKCCHYISIDKECWTDRTIKADFNKGEFPDLSGQRVIVCQGVLEYLNDPEGFLDKIKKYGGIMLLTYWLGESNDGMKVNSMGMQELKEMLSRTGWKVVFSRTISSNQKLFYCSKI